MSEDVIRVMRIVEIIGPRSWVEKTVAASVQGTRACGRGCEIRAATIGAYPDILMPELDVVDERENVGYPEKQLYGRVP